MSATDYDNGIGRAAREVLLGASAVPLDVRRAVLQRLMAMEGPDALVEAFAHFIGLANSVVANAREMVEIELIVRGDMHPYTAEKVNLPTIWGALFGLRLAEGLDCAGTCAGCAYRIGTPANQSPVTTLDASTMAEPGEDAFFCHEDLDVKGEPTKGCAGFAKARVKRKAEHVARLRAAHPLRFAGQSDADVLEWMAAFEDSEFEDAQVPA